MARLATPSSVRWMVAARAGRIALQKRCMSGEDSQAFCATGSGSVWITAAAMAPPQLAKITSGGWPVSQAAAYMPR
jgi:hypothetical protein